MRKPLPPLTRRVRARARSAALLPTARSPDFSSTLQADVDFLVRFIQANEGGEGLVLIILIHGSCLLFCVELICVCGRTRIAPVLRKPYSRGVEIRVGK